MRAVFFGTPELAVASLQALTEVATVVGVVCQPDRPAGRGLALRPPPVKLAAERLGLDVRQPVKVRTGDLHEWIADRHADVAVVLAYGRILPPSVLAAPRVGCINLHASLLPKYRGAAPINWAIARGETQTGISLMHMDEGLDTGPVYLRRAIPIGPYETAGELAHRLAALAATMVREDVPRVVTGEVAREPQDDQLASWAPPISREDTRIRWTSPASDIAALIRGMSPRPGAFTTVRGKSLRVAEARAVTRGPDGPPGTVTTDGASIRVAAGSGSVEIVRAQLEGRKELTSRDLTNGRVLVAGDVLGD
jgi:methionyl-tRNA formyltransferase